MVGNDFRSLLPASSLSSERAQEQATAEPILAINTDMVRWVKNPDLCPVSLLPWLAWEYAVDFWDESWTEEQKRQVIRDAAYIHQHRGTAGAVRRALLSADYSSNVVEWWQESPQTDPYTFRVEITTQNAVTSELYGLLRSQIIKAKNLRSSLTSIDVITDVGTTGQYYMSGAVTANIDVIIEPGGE